MVQFLKLITLIFAIALAFVGCATQSKTRASSEYLLTTDKGTTSLFKEIAKTMDEHKYSVKKEDVSAGILLLSPRRFSFVNDDRRKTQARQTVQLRQEGGSVKVRISYECNYANDGKDFVPCYDEPALDTKVGRIESILVELLQPTMLKHSAEPTETATAESKKEKGADDAKSREPASEKAADGTLFER